jgi:quinol-cytochrome oxidoreductase complex cytochrome b subunit
MGELWRLFTRAASQFWTDLKASTDAGVLAVVRFFGFLYGPIDVGAPIDVAMRKSLRHRLPAHVTWKHALGGVVHLLFLILIVTGVLLAVYYRPSAQEAYPSIQHIVSEVTFGWLMRDVHAWAANLIVLAMLAHMARVFYDAAYLSPRETNWLVGVMLLFVVLAFGATGYLLPWDQWSYWSVTEALGAVGRIPVIGRPLLTTLRGDPIVSGATLSRFFAAHVIVLPWVAFGLLNFHFALSRRHGIAPPRHPVAEPAIGRQFFPNHLLRSFMVATFTCALLVTAAVMAPRPVAAPADPGAVPDLVRSTWIVVDVSRAMTHFLGGWGLALFTLLGVALALVPLLHRGPARSLRERPVASVIAILFFAGFLLAWLAGTRLQTVPPAVLEQVAEPSAPPITTPQLLPDSAATVDTIGTPRDTAGKTGGGDQ